MRYDWSCAWCSRANASAVPTPRPALLRCDEQIPVVGGIRGKRQHVRLNVTLHMLGNPGESNGPHAAPGHQTFSPARDALTEALDPLGRREGQKWRPVRSREGCNAHAIGKRKIRDVGNDVLEQQRESSARNSIERAQPDLAPDSRCARVRPRRTRVARKGDHIAHVLVHDGTATSSYEEVTRERAGRYLPLSSLGMLSTIEQLEFHSRTE